MRRLTAGKWHDLRWRPAAHSVSITGYRFSGFISSSFHPSHKSGSLVSRGYGQASDIDVRLLHPWSDRLSCLRACASPLLVPTLFRASECLETINLAGPRPKWPLDTQASALADRDSAHSYNSGRMHSSLK